jgi:hypothetical protein
MEAILERIERDGGAAQVRRLWMPPEDPAAFAVLSGMRFPLVEELVLPSAFVRGGPGRETWLREMPRLRRVTFGFTMADDGLIAAMAALPWWRQLTFLDAKFGQLQKTGGLGALWEGTALEELRLCYPGAADARCLLGFPFARLRLLALCGETGDAFLEGLAGASLPFLEDLDVRATSVSAAGVRAFVAAPRAGLPRLRRMGIAFASDREEPYHDWNGALVGSGYEPMTSGELEGAFFAGSSLRLMPEIERWPK